MLDYDVTDPCKQSKRIEMTGWFKQYFPGNLRKNFLFTVCNYANLFTVCNTVYGL